MAAIGLLMALVALGNVLDYGSNWQFVRHVMAMDATFPTSTQHWRAITSEPLQRLAYLAIIAVQAVSAALLLLSAARLFARARSAAQFRDEAVPLAAAGLTLVMLIYGAGFLAIGGEWFEMWQAGSWNGHDRRPPGSSPWPPPCSSCCCRPARGGLRCRLAGRRARSAVAIVPSSSQSSSPPTGTPRAKLVTSTFSAASRSVR